MTPTPDPDVVKTIVSAGRMMLTIILGGIIWAAVYGLLVVWKTPIGVQP